MSQAGAGEKSACVPYIGLNLKVHRGESLLASQLQFALAPARARCSKRERARASEALGRAVRGPGSLQCLLVGQC